MDIDDPNKTDTEKDIIISPRRGKNEKRIPESGILLVNPTEAKYAQAKLLSEGGERRVFHHSQLCIDSDNQFFIAGPAVSAPVAAMTVEKLIALGARRIYLFSWCGAISPLLRIGDVIVGGEPLAGEGTSLYYRTNRPSLPSIKCAGKLQMAARQMDMRVQVGKIWTTDAPYRENRRFLKRIWQEDGVVGVDMEYSALCAVCGFRNIEFAGIFIISDELWGEKWRPGFKKSEFLVTGRKIIDLLLNVKFHAMD